MASTKVRGKGLGTLGDGTASDYAIVFDGNAQDFHIGLDDSSDDLVIGLGSALGTTTHMAFTEDGEVTKPLQPAFMVNKSTEQSNIATGSEVSVSFDTEQYDIGSNFASNTFTAPVTGKYLLRVSLYLRNVDTAANYYRVDLNTSNREYRWMEGFNTDGGDYEYYVANVTAIADMDASDTATVGITQVGGTAQTDIDTDGARTYFQGYLLG